LGLDHCGEALPDAGLVVGERQHRPAGLDGDFRESRRAERANLGEAAWYFSRSERACNWLHVATVHLEPTFKSRAAVMDTADLTIGQLADRVGINASAIRYYEREGVLPVAARGAGPRRSGAAPVR